MDYLIINHQYVFVYHEDIIMRLKHQDYDPKRTKKKKKKIRNKKLIIVEIFLFQIKKHMHAPIIKLLFTIIIIR
jgi:hypothetical protein